MTYRINIKFSAPKEEIKFAFDVDLVDAYDQDEVGKTGSFLLANAEGESAVELGLYYTVLYGERVELNILTNENYVLNRLYLNTTEMSYDITGFVVDGQLIIDEKLMNSYFDYQITIVATFERLLWTDSRSDAFLGKGNKNSPYVISTAEDFGLLAYVVNSGLINSDGVLYSECWYEVTEDIDFAGRYFEPIGTEENPFNGTINLGKHQFKNVAHYREYSDPKTSYSAPPAQGCSKS